MTKSRTKPLGESKEAIKRVPSTHIAIRQENRQGCPVTALAVQISDCWAAQAGADGQPGDRAGDDAEVIAEYRKALEDLVTFEQAGSIGGALFQIVLAALELETLVGKLPDSVQAEIWREERKVARLLESAAAAIMDGIAPAQLADVMPTVRIYVGPDRTPAWGWRHRWPEYVASGRADGAGRVGADQLDGGRHG